MINPKTFLYFFIPYFVVQIGPILIQDNFQNLIEQDTINILKFICIVVGGFFEIATTIWIIIKIFSNLKELIAFFTNRTPDYSFLRDFFQFIISGWTVLTLAKLFLLLNEKYSTTQTIIATSSSLLNLLVTFLILMTIVIIWAIISGKIFSRWEIITYMTIFYYPIVALIFASLYKYTPNSIVYTEITKQGVPLSNYEYIYYGFISLFVANDNSFVAQGIGRLYTTLQYYLGGFFLPGIILGGVFNVPEILKENKNKKNK